MLCTDVCSDWKDVERLGREILVGYVQILSPHTSPRKKAVSFLPILSILFRWPVPYGSKDSLLKGISNYLFSCLSNVLNKLVYKTVRKNKTFAAHNCHDGNIKLLSRIWDWYLPWTAETVNFKLCMKPYRGSYNNFGSKSQRTVDNMYWRWEFSIFPHICHIAAILGKLMTCLGYVMKWLLWVWDSNA